MHKQLFMLFFISVFTSAAYAASEKYDLYHDTPNCDLSTCTNCSAAANMTLAVKTQTINNTVIITSYTDGKLSGSRALKGCAVVDNINWHCNDESGQFMVIEGLLIHPGLHGACGKRH